MFDDHLAQPESMPYIHALLEAIRAKVRAWQLESSPRRVVPTLVIDLTSAPSVNAPIVSAW